MGMDWTLREGYSWAEDKEHCEEYGRMLQAQPNKVSARAKKRGLPQLGTLGAGNHYGEVQVYSVLFCESTLNAQVVDEIFDECRVGLVVHPALTRTLVEGHAVVSGPSAVGLAQDDEIG